jgi:hypothetical protein
MTGASEYECRHDRRIDIDPCSRPALPFGDRLHRRPHIEARSCERTRQRQRPGSRRSQDTPALRDAALILLLNSRHFSEPRSDCEHQTIYQRCQALGALGWRVSPSCSANFRHYAPVAADDPKPKCRISGVL